MAQIPDVKRRRLVEALAAVALAGVLVVAAVGLAFPLYRRHLLNPQLVQALDDADSARAYNLIRAGARADLRGTRGHTVLFIAAAHGHMPLLREALARGLLAKQGDNRNPVIVFAASLGQASSVNVLLEAGDNPNARDWLGETALMWASRQGYSDIVASLLAHGADPSMKDDSGNTALDHTLQAKESGSFDTAQIEAVISLLRRHGARRGTHQSTHFDVQNTSNGLRKWIPAGARQLTPGA